jgi:hypothetical protein
LLITIPWALVDFVLILAGSTKDSYGRPLV